MLRTKDRYCARYIFLNDEEFTARFEKVEKELASNRKMILDLYEPNAQTQGIPSDIIALEEQLFIEFKTQTSSI